MIQFQRLEQRTVRAFGHGPHEAVMAREDRACRGFGGQPRRVARGQ